MNARFHPVAPGAGVRPFVVLAALQARAAVRLAWRRPWVLAAAAAAVITYGCMTFVSRATGPPSASPSLMAVIVVAAVLATVALGWFQVPLVSLHALVAGPVSRRTVATIVHVRNVLIVGTCLALVGILGGSPAGAVAFAAPSVALAVGAACALLDVALLSLPHRSRLAGGALVPAAILVVVAPPSDDALASMLLLSDDTSAPIVLALASASLAVTVTVVRWMPDLRDHLPARADVLRGSHAPHARSVARSARGSRWMRGGRAVIWPLVATWLRPRQPLLLAAGVAAAGICVLLARSDLMAGFTVTFPLAIAWGQTDAPFVPSWLRSLPVTPSRMVLGRLAARAVPLVVVQWVLLAALGARFHGHHAWPLVALAAVGPAPIVHVALAAAWEASWYHGSSPARRAFACGAALFGSLGAMLLAGLACSGLSPRHGLASALAASLVTGLLVATLLVVRAVRAYRPS